MARKRGPETCGHGRTLDEPCVECRQDRTCRKCRTTVDVFYWPPKGPYCIKCHPKQVSYREALDNLDDAIAKLSRFTRRLK